MIGPFSLTGLLQESQMCERDKEVLWQSGGEAWSLPLFPVASLRHFHRVPQHSQGSPEGTFKTTGLDAFKMLPCWEREEPPEALPSFA